MTFEGKKSSDRKRRCNLSLPGVAWFLALMALLGTSCGQLARPEAEPFYAQTAPPQRQEFRWSNGRAPKSLDPARAATAPETDIVRALYEGLTDLDPRTLQAVPGVAEKWESSPDLRIWTFHLRKDSRWTNGENVVAADFVRSWKRLVPMKDQAVNKFLFQNIVGMKQPEAAPNATSTGPTDFLRDTPDATLPPVQRKQVETNASPTPLASSQPPVAPDRPVESPKKAAELKLGVEAVDEKTLRVTLDMPDKDFPKLVANPVFRPIYGDSNEPAIDPRTVTNGAFRIASVAATGIALDRSDTYWDRKSVILEHVRFVPVESAEKALAGYKSGNIDAVSNADFEPLALKLLAPYEDFRRTRHSALNFYEINARSAPFSDRRVRLALAIAIDRERLTEGELEGSTQPAYSFLPLAEPDLPALSLDVNRAKDLLSKAGYPNGTNFPPIRLVINRNDTQQRVAKSVARMWRQNLNLETLIIVKESAEMEQTRNTGEFDLIRRGAVIPTTNELVSLTFVFGSDRTMDNPVTPTGKRPDESNDISPDPNSASGPALEDNIRPDRSLQNQNYGSGEPSSLTALNAEDSIFNVYAIPLYFPTSYALVKPYVRGFDMNGLDAPSLKGITIDNNWQLKGDSVESN